MISWQKGFSLIEVLVSLLLVSTVALMLLEQQGSNKLLLSRLLLYADVSHALDQMNEASWAGINSAWKGASSYPVVKSQTKHYVAFTFEHPNAVQSVQRKIMNIRENE